MLPLAFSRHFKTSTPVHHRYCTNHCIWRGMYMCDAAQRQHADAANIRSSPAKTLRILTLSHAADGTSWIVRVTPAWRLDRSSTAITQSKWYP